MASPPLTQREYAYFRVTGKGSHTLISKTLGLKPINEWSEGDINPRDNLPRKFMSWNYASGLDDTHLMDEHIEKLFSILEPLKEELLELGKDYNLCIQCVGYYPPGGHGIHLSRDVMTKASMLGLAFDCDFYYVDDYGHGLDYH